MFFSVSSETIKATIILCRNLKELPSFLKTILQIGTFDFFNGRAIKTEYKIAIQSAFLFKIPSRKEKI